jgi:alanine racemase
LQNRCWAEIDLSAFERNLNRIQAALSPNVRYMSVVKADAYGHGMPQMVRRLMQCGVHHFAVANVYEAAEIRYMGEGWPILILGPLLPEEDRYLIDYDLIGTVSTAEEVERLNAIGKEHGSKLQIHLKIDTGMGRLGVWHENAIGLIETIKNQPQLILKGIYTHFSSADSDPDFTQLQRKRFLDLLKHIDTESLMVHADNSASLASLSGESPFNAVRVGLLQLGIQPYPDSILGHLEVEPVFSFYTRVGIVKHLPKGSPISYGRSFCLKRDSKIAVLTAGYADGIPIALSNQGGVLINGQCCPIIGRVTMDQTIVDITELKDSVRSGDRATFIGRDKAAEITASDFSRVAGTIPWETLCSITKRVERVYVGSREI